MATTLYFATETASAREPGTYPVDATNYANLTPDRAITTGGYMLPYPWRAVANLSQSSVNRTTAQVAKFGRFFSAPFARDFVYTHPLDSDSEIRYYVADYQSNASANHCVQQCHIFVWRPSTGQVVGVIQPVSVQATGTKEPTATASIRATLGSYFAAGAGTISILKGDILVFEPFSTFTQAAATAYTIRFYYGGATEITTENTVVSTPASKVVFSVDLPLEAPIGAVTGAINYHASMLFLNPQFVTALRARAKVSKATLVDGSPFISRIGSRASAQAQLTTQALLTAALKSNSNLSAWMQQSHDFSLALGVSARAYATFPDRGVGESLSLHYTYPGSAENPALSLGGPKGGALQGSSFSSAPSVPGVQILAVSWTPEPREYLLRLDAEARTVSMVLAEGLYGFTAGIDAGVTTVLVGSQEAGFVCLRADTATLTSTDITVSSSPRDNTLFPNPSPQALAEGETLYRCLYLFNDTDQDVLSVSLSVSEDAPSAVVEVATEFDTTVQLYGHDDRQMPRSVQHRALDPTGWGGIFFLEQAPQGVAELSVNSLPILLSAPLIGQASDGATVQVPHRVEDERDSFGRLASLSFGAALSWAKIPARRGVTFWVRRVQSAGAPADATYRAIFDVTADF